MWAYFLPCLPVSERNLGQGIDDSYAPPFCEECLLYPNVAYPHRGKTGQSASDVGARRLGQDEQYLTVREILSEASTLVPPRAGLSRERSDFYRFGYEMLGFILTERWYRSIFVSMVSVTFG